MTPSGIPDASADSRGLMTVAQFVALASVAGASHPAVTIGTANGLSLATQQLSLAAADGSNPGALTAGAQTIGGVKTFTDAILNGATTIAEAVSAVVRASAASLSLRSSLGAGASDVGVKNGFSTAHASVNSAAQPLAVYTGLGGSETKVLYINKAGSIAIAANANCVLSDAGNVIFASGNIGSAGYMYAMGASTGFYALSNGAFSSAGTGRLWSETRGNGSGERSWWMGTLEATAHADAKLTSWGSNLSNASPTELACVWGSGNFEVLTSGGGIYLKSPNGTRYLVSVADGGTIAVTAAP